MRYTAVISALSIMAVAVPLAGGPARSGETDQRYLYQWTDDRGNVGIADDLTKVPPEYRTRARKMQQPGSGETGGAPGQDPGQEAREMRQRMAAEGERAAESASDSDEIKKAEWQQRMADAKRNLAAAEARNLQIEQRKGELKAKWGASGASLPPQEVMDEMSRLESEQVTARKEVDRAKNQIDVVIPEEARRAGIPPGWLREVR